MQERIRQAYHQVKAAERARRERPNEVRATAWWLFTASTPGSWPFWRHGFASRFGRRLARGADFTIIPGYDEIGQEIATQFPEYADDDGTERLWSFLLSPYDRLPNRDEMMRKARDLAETWAPSPDPKIPF
jgi:hypothetical protein